MAILKPFSPFTDAKGKLPFELVRPEIRKVEKQIREQVEAFVNHPHALININLEDL